MVAGGFEADDYVDAPEYCGRRLSGASAPISPGPAAARRLCGRGVRYAESGERMKVVVIGCGRVGSAVALSLRSQPAGR